LFEIKNCLIFKNLFYSIYVCDLFGKNLHPIVIPLIITNYVPESIAMASNLIGISYTVRNDSDVAPATPNVEIIAKPICPQLEHTPAPKPIAEPTIPVPVFLEVPFMTLIWKTARLVTSAISPETTMIRTKLRIQSIGSWNAKNGSKNKNSRAYNMKIKITENKEAEIIQEEIFE